MSVIILSVFSLVLNTIAEPVKDNKFTVNWKCRADKSELGMGDSYEPVMEFRNGIFNPKYHWPNGIIPFEINEDFAQDELEIIKKAMEDFHLLTCIRFIPRSRNDRDYIGITKNQDYCSSQHGRHGGYQNLNLGYECFKKFIIIHELMHAVGFYHEQRRHDRDKHIKILWENILPNLTSEYQKLIGGYNFGADYTYGSILHYGQGAGSSNGLPTMEPFVPGVTLGNQIGLHRSDVKRINNMYNCPDKEIPEYGWNSDDIWVGT